MGDKSDPTRSHGNAISAAGRLAVWLLVCFVAWLVLAPPRLVPPGNVWTFGDTLTCILVIFGAYHAARPGLSRIFYFLYGCLASCFIVSVLLPDNRDYIAIGMGRDRIEPYILRACALFLALGLLSLVAAQVRLSRIARASSSAEDARCGTCGYLLYGLPEPRCPECGTPFDPQRIPKDNAP